MNIELRSPVSPSNKNQKREKIVDLTVTNRSLFLEENKNIESEIGNRNDKERERRILR